jgi:LmbE family N-acetylglucosaminyl deacetylase
MSPTDPPRRTRTLLAAFAHPDDETIAGPLLARYGREPRTKVILVVATNGELGTRPFADIPAGEALAAVRAREAACACEALGIEPPILLGLPDGGLGSKSVRPRLTAELRRVLGEVEPDAIVTWGPDGGSGHSDHRAVGVVVTQLVEAGETTPLLYYPGLPKSRVAAAGKGLPYRAFGTVADELLNARVPYTPEDAERARRALACHKSQFSPEALESFAAVALGVHDGQMHLRSWAGGPRRADLFEP